MIDNRTDTDISRCCRAGAAFVPQVDKEVFIAVELWWEFTAE